MNKKTGDTLKEVLIKVDPSKEDLKKINESLKQFKEKIEKQIKRHKLNAVIFEGGSFAKKTLIKKNNYDIDIFIMFSEKFRGQNISKLTEKLLKGFKEVSVIHGSRDYFQINKSKDFFIELVPVIKVNDPKKAENITDLSYSHVKYINKKIKSQKILDEIKIAKAFCYATKTYGAESYINGFSGYSLELLVYYYKGFLNFIKAVAGYDPRKGKLIIDIEKHYKNKNDVLLDMNSSKLGSPIILVDPTYKQRNAIAALSKETFERFKQASKKFLKNPSIKNFEIKKIDLEKIKKDALNKKNEFILLELKTQKPAGAVAGSKFLKFYNHLENEISPKGVSSGERFYEIKNKGFEYNQENNAICFFAVKPKKEIVIEGPFIKDKNNIKKFKKLHKKTFYKSNKIYAREKINFSLNEFIKNWKKKYQKKIIEMSISWMNVVE
ncbi:MAG: hypothetical protein Q8O84_03160 [Nanoarchaeota archaeon]|nr:hypothetical protein [Nanoarchaeota archaeon]